MCLNPCSDTFIFTPNQASSAVESTGIALNYSAVKVKNTIKRHLNLIFSYHFWTIFPLQLSSQSLGSQIASALNKSW